MYNIIDVENIDEINDVKLYVNANYRIIKWFHEDKAVYVSFTRRGNAIIAHIASNRKSRKYLRKAVNEVCEAFFLLYDWCEIIIGVVDNRSVLNLTHNCGFKLLNHTIIDKELISIVGRMRQWAVP